MNDQEEQSVEVFQPRNTLKEKVGNGGIPQENLDRAQDAMDDFEFDFDTFGRELLNRFGETIKSARISFDEPDSTEDDVKYNLLFALANVMEIKANGGMFGAPVMSEAADISLSFLEKINSVNEDTFDFLEIHHRVLTLIHTQNIQDLNTPQSTALIKELRLASERYFAKYES